MTGAREGRLVLERAGERLGRLNGTRGAWEKWMALGRVIMFRPMGFSTWVFEPASTREKWMMVDRWCSSLWVLGNAMVLEKIIVLGNAVVLKKIPCGIADRWAVRNSGYHHLSNNLNLKFIEFFQVSKKLILFLEIKTIQPIIYVYTLHFSLYFSYNITIVFLLWDQYIHKENAACSLSTTTRSVFSS